MKRMQRISLLLCLFLSGSTFAQFRKYSNEFLHIGAGARALSMGGAQVASIADGNGGYWNPAALVGVKDHPQLNLMHAEYFAGIGKYDYASLAMPIQNGSSVLGITLLRFAVDDIPNTVFLVEPDGTINFSNITTFSSADYAFMVSLGQEKKMFRGKQLSYGGTAKVIHRKAGDFTSAWGFGFDGGVQLRAKKWQLGLLARDITTTFTAWSFSLSDRMRDVFYVTGNDIPSKSTELTAPRIIAGGSYQFTITNSIKLLTEIDLEMTFDGKRNTVIQSNLMNVDPRLGIEGAWKDQLFLRLGINNFQRALDDADISNTKKIWIYQPSLGTGFKVGNVAIDYAFTNLANQSNPLYTHVFSFKVDLVKK